MAQDVQTTEVDPDENLASQRRLVEQISNTVAAGMMDSRDEANLLAELVRSLDEFISDGGSLPSSWEEGTVDRWDEDPPELAEEEPPPPTGGDPPPLTEDQAKLLRGLVRADYRKTIKGEASLRRKVGGAFDGTRIHSRRRFLNGIHQALGGRKLTTTNPYED